jgi:hypothetical protein
MVATVMLIGGGLPIAVRKPSGDLPLLLIYVRPMITTASEPALVDEIKAGSNRFSGSKMGPIKDSTMMHIISLGAGVQSTTMSLMAAHGEITPMPDCAIFADTQWEPDSVYTHLGWLCKQLPFPVHIVTAGNLREAVMSRSNTTGGRFAAVPWFMKMPNGDDAMGRRQCTAEYKLRPIQKKIVELTGGRRKNSAEVWIGISTDEAIRCKPSRVQYIVNRWPLLENHINRNDCLAWLHRKGYPTPPRSACIGCPFHNDGYWRKLKLFGGKDWKNAIEVDEAIRVQPGFRGEQYMHRSLVPLKDVDLTTLEDAGQLNMFNNECEGMCGI